MKADRIILGSPTYFADIAAMVAVRRRGAIHAYDSINYFFLINQMVVPVSSYWNMGMGREIGDVDKDDEGMRNMKNFGENMPWLLKKIANPM